MKKKIKHFLEQYDGIWSIPFAFITFWLIGIVLQFLDVTAGSYDLAFIQPLFLAIGIVIGAVNATIVGLRFTFKGFYRYIYGYRNEDGIIINQSKEDFKKLELWQKFIVAFLPFYFLVALIVIVYLKMI